MNLIHFTWTVKVTGTSLESFRGLPFFFFSTVSPSSSSFRLGALSGLAAGIFSSLSLLLSRISLGLLSLIKLWSFSLNKLKKKSFTFCTSWFQKLPHILHATFLRVKSYVLSLVWVSFKRHKGQRRKLQRHGISPAKVPHAAQQPIRHILSFKELINRAVSNWVKLQITTLLWHSVPTAIRSLPLGWQNDSALRKKLEQFTSCPPMDTSCWLT